MNKKNEEKQLDWKAFFSGFFLLLCALSLILIAFSLRPVAKWAEYQSSCVEQEMKKSPVEWAVRKCNGRSKVYQVK
tara:strand:+ start:191 stop:418 length:228 start_codon:yes stop_codon:yes gene_type:complete